MENSVFIVIAALNEEKSILKVIARLQKAGYRNIVVVDDGSKDNTSDVAYEAGATVLQNIINRGQGASLQTGIDYALNKGADIIVTFDADGQHRVEDLSEMIKPVKTGEADITIGSRFLKQESIRKVPLIRKILLKGSIFVVRVFYGVKMTDAHNGLRVFSRRAAKKIRITADRMAHASEIIEKIHRFKIKYKEVPVVINYTKETMRKGHGSFKESIHILETMIINKFILK